MAPEKIATMDYDIVYIGILNEKYAQQLRKTLKNGNRRTKDYLFQNAGC